MAWLLILQAVLLTLLPIIRSEDVVINQIRIPSSGETSFYVCWVETSQTYSYAEMTIVQESSEVTEKQFTGNVDVFRPCVTLKNGVAFSLSNGVKVSFILRLFIASPVSNVQPINPDSIGLAAFKWIDTNTLALCESVNILGNNIILRTQCSILKDDDDIFVINGQDLVITGQSTESAGTVYYKFNNEFLVPISLHTCREVADAEINIPGNIGTVRVCHLAGDVVGVKAELGMTEAELNYDKGTVTKTTSSESNAFEFVHFWTEDSGDTYQFSSICSLEPCSQYPYTTGLNILNILVVGYDNSLPPTIKESINHPFQDYNLQANLLFSSTLEMIWEPKDSGDSLFWITLEGCNLNGAFNEAQVTCSSDSLGCYGYFFDIPSGSLSCNAALFPDEIGTKNLMNKIVKPVSKLSQAQDDLKELQILVADVNWNKDNNPSTRVCFYHTSQNTWRSLFHYELLLANKQGQWQKHKLMTQDTEGDLCFPEFTLNTEAFNITEGVNLIVTQRAEDGFKVLAGGETHIKFDRTH